MYDFIIVGSGLFGAVVANELKKKKYKILIIEKRNHIGGNIYTEKINNIHVHKYGAHIFHTNDLRIWNYVNDITPFHFYKHKVLVNYKNEIFSFPINLLTLNKLWGINSPKDAKDKLDILKKPTNNENLEDWILSQIGDELYEIFVRGYTSKQWGRNPKELPSSIIKRIPIRTDFNDSYFDDLYQGIPSKGYTHLIEQMIDGVEVKLNTDFIEGKSFYENKSQKIIYTGAIDQLLNYKHGMLEYRSLKFENEFISNTDFQGISVMNYTDEKVPYTRIIEHKHFDVKSHIDTIITKEFPMEWSKGKEAYYPINNKMNNAVYEKYKKEINNNKYILGGRLATYKYYDMHQVIGSALKSITNL